MRRKQFGIRNSELGNDAGARERRLLSSAFRIPHSAFALVIVLAVAASPLASAQDTSAGDKMLAEYFRAETAKLAERCLADIRSLEDWTSKRSEYRRQLAEMLGLDPMPERTDLKAVITGKLENEFFTVEKVQFQSRPGLYVTGDLYLPKHTDKPAPAVLYVCGHGQVKKNGVSLGNKTAYQHHGGWLARNGFVCLTIDTIQLGEIEGIHHGTYREGMWWWNSRGYTPAGVEAWNGIRALDYLQSRPEVDGEKLGVAGRSGGGAYSWWIAALDERVKAAVPTAGITDLENHVVDGVVEGHCDCMFMVNTYRWDYPQVAALVAPRALLLTNTDKDTIFPLDGVVRVHRKVRDIYRLYDAEKQLGLQISEGPHKDIQELQVAEFHWFNRFLKGEDAPVENTGIKYFEPEDLKVFESLPADEITSHIHDSFVAAAKSKVPEDKEELARMRDGWMKALKEKCFAGWPEEPGPLNVKQAFSVERNGLVLKAYDFDSQETVRLRMYIWHGSGINRVECLSIETGVELAQGTLCMFRDNFPDAFRDSGLPQPTFETKIVEDPSTTHVILLPRGLGRHKWNPDPKRQIHNRRRFMLLGQTLAGMQIWDVRRALQTLRSLDEYRHASMVISGEADMAAVVLYASLFEPPLDELYLHYLPKSHVTDAPDILNVLRVLDMPQALAMAAERQRVIAGVVGKDGWEFPLAVSEKLGWAENSPPNLSLGDLSPPKLEDSQ